MNTKNKQNDAKSSGQVSQLDNGNNPRGVASLKATRRTNEVPAGTAYLRDVEKGLNR